MPDVSIKEFGLTCWTEVYNRIIGAVIFLDEVSAESLHWHGSLFKLFDEGAVAVKALTPFETTNRKFRKAVFLTSATRNQLDSVKEVIKLNNFSHCIIISTTALDAVYSELNDHKDLTELTHSGHLHSVACKALEEMVKSWINQQPSSVEVIHLPIFTISPMTNTFLTPFYKNLFPNFNGKLITELGTSLDLFSLSRTDRSIVRRVASNLNSLFDSLNIKDDVYYMGLFSSIVAGVLEHSPVCTARRKNCSQPASLILIDRTLDLCAVTSHSSENFLDKIMTALPRFPTHTVDVAVDMSPICVAKVKSTEDEFQLSPGCLHHEGDDDACQTFDILTNMSQKEIMIRIYDGLSNLDGTKSPTPKSLTKVTTQMIEKFLTKGNLSNNSKHTALVQQALAAVQTLKSKNIEQAELITSLERQAHQSIMTSGDSTSILNQISQLIKLRNERNLPLQRLLALLVHIYSLVGDEINFSSAHEENLKETLSKALYEDRKTIFSEEFLEHIDAEVQTSEIAKKIMQRLREISQTRRLLSKYKSVLKPSETSSGYEYKGILQQLIEDLVDTDKPDMSDLKHRSDGIKDLLMSGIGMLMNTTSKKRAKHPLDNPLVIIYVIGGINAFELQKLHRIINTSGCDSQVIIASNKLVNPLEAMKDALSIGLLADSSTFTKTISINNSLFS